MEDHTTNPLLNAPPAWLLGERLLSVLADAGAAFVPVQKRGKMPVGGKGWQDKPFPHDDAVAWLKNGGSVGLLCGHGMLIIIDADRDADAVLSAEPRLGETLKIFRRNADDRAKWIVRMTDELPLTKKHERIEILAPGRQGVVCGTHESGATIEWQNERIVELSHADIDRLWTTLTGKPLHTDAPKLPATAAPASSVAEIDDDELLRRIRNSKQGASFERLWNGDTSRFAGDHSAADLALCNILAFWTGRDAERMDRLFRQSGLSRPKWDEPARSGETYGAGTIREACESATETYKPGNGATAERRDRAGGGGVAGDIDWLDHHPHEYDLAEAFLARHGGQWLHVPMNGDTGAWLQWTGAMWQADETLRMKNILREMQEEAHEAWKAEAYATEDEDKRAEMLSTAAGWRPTKSRTYAAQSQIAMSESVARSALGAGNLLNLANGIYDLDAYTLRPHEPGALQTTLLDYAYDPDAECPRWQQFVREVCLTGPAGEYDADLAALLQEAFGYALTTETRYEAFFFLSGTGANGKSTALKVLAGLLGEHARPLNLEALALPGSDYHLAGIQNRRALFCTEASTTARVAESIFKLIASGEEITARPIREAPINFRPIAKLFWSANQLPTVRDQSDGFWRRLRLLPFNAQFTEQQRDVRLSETLAGELPGIFRWSVEGLRRLRANGQFTAARQAVDAASDYRETHISAVVRWLDECTTLGLPQTAKANGKLLTALIDATDERTINWTSARTAWQRYHDWISANDPGAKTWNQTLFGAELTNELKRRGLEKRRNKSANAWRYPFASVRRDESGGMFVTLEAASPVAVTLETDAERILREAAV